MIIDAYLIRPTQTQPSYFSNVELFSFFTRRMGIRERGGKKKENLSLVSPGQLKNKT